MRVISLFSGAGGLDLGFIQAGHEIIWANDNDADAVETYKLNIGNHIILSDIENILSTKIPDANVVIGGFPCQGFSQANLNRSVNDDRNKLYLQFLRVIRDKQPVCFLAENVKGILSLNKGNAIKRIISDFNKAGYRVKYNLFNTANYGVPQTRQRVIIVGIRSDVPDTIEYIFPKQSHSRKKDTSNLPVWITISEALEGIPDPTGNDDDLPNHIFSKYKITNRNFTGHRRTNPEKPSPTILARGNGRGGVCAIQHPRNHRRMSVRESAIIQTFPQDFVFVGRMGSGYRQVGNAVPVLFAKHLGIQLSQLETELQKETTLCV